MPPDSSAARFLMVGAGNTLAGLAIIYIVKLMGSGDVAANATGYAFGLVLSFTLNRRWTFRHSGPIFEALVRFFVVLTIAYAANLAVVLGAISWFDINSYVSQALGVPVYTAFSYLGSRWYVFPTRNTSLEKST